MLMMALWEDAMMKPVTNMIVMMVDCDKITIVHVNFLPCVLIFHKEAEFH